MNEKKGTKKIKDLAKMRITVKLFVVLAFAGVLLSGYGAAGPGGKTTGTRRDCPRSFTTATMPPNMPNYFTLGNSVSTGPVSGGSTPSARSMAWNNNFAHQSTCTPLFIFRRVSLSLSRGSETCTYNVTTCSATSGPGCSDCNSVVTAQKITVTFTCPDSTGCY